MNYQEAKKVQDENFDILNPQMIPSEPPHLVLGSIIAPEGSNQLTLGGIYSIIKDDEIPNKEVLLSNNLLGDNLIVYIVYKMRGYTISQSLESYKESRLLDESGN